MKKCFFAFLLFVGTLSAMAQETTEMQQVIAKHDELMEKMPGLVKLINKLQTAAQNSEDQAKYELAIEDLRTANKSMQNWMIGFGKRFDADEMMKGKKLTAQKKEWLQEEKTKILVLDKEINNSIDEAKTLLPE
ncbi:MAG: hypothetical protein ACR2MT_01835 [Aurantibacter sp.]